MRPSGTLQSPTTGLLADMMRETEREEQIAAARALPTHATIQLRDAPLEVAKPTDATLMKPAQKTVDTHAANNTTPAPQPVQTNTNAAPAPVPNNSAVATNNNKPA